MALCLLLLYFNAPFLLEKYALLYRVNNPTKGADAILVLAGNSGPRLTKAIELIQNEYSKIIFITDFQEVIPKYKNIIQSESEIIRQILAQEGMMASKIPSDKGGVTSTFDEAHDLARYIKRNHLKHIIIVTDSFHTARSYYAFKKIFALNNINTMLEMSAAPNPVFNESNWWKTESGLSNYILEPIKFFVYLLRDKNVTFVTEN